MERAPKRHEPARLPQPLADQSPYLPPLPMPPVVADYVPQQPVVTQAGGALPVEAMTTIPQEGAASPERRRITLTGRVGAAPAFRTTPKGQLVARFPLGTHPNETSTAWKTVLTFGARADKLRGTLRKGKQVEVVGYLHTREVRGRDGNPKTVEEVYAVAVRKEGSPRGGLSA